MYWILSDIGSDLPKTFADQYDRFKVLPMPYRMDGVEKSYRIGDEATVEEIYRKLGEGVRITTAQITVDTYVTALRELAARGEPALCLTLSSGLSGSLQSAVLARSMVMEQYPGAQIIVVDSLCASLGFGLLTQYALRNRAAGMTMEDNARWLTDNRQRLIHWFTVDDLDFLFRGGRLTRSSAMLGAMLRIKPILHVNHEGKLVPFEKVQGRKKSLKTLADKVIQQAKPREGQDIFISHGNCREDAQYVADLISQGLPRHGSFLISPCSTIIGAHAGPGTLAVFFLGDRR
ncbi:MAG: DegV family protein [Christensenellales bacterium]